MKCRESKEAILLLSELTAVERERLDSHIQSCDDCKQFYQEAQHFSLLVKKAASAQPMVANAVASTDTIMDRILREKRSASKEHGSLSSFLSALWPRYSLAGISVCLIVFFLMEVNQPAIGSSTSENVTSARRPVILESKSLRANFSRNDHERPLVIAQCVPSQAGMIDINCIKQKLRSSNF